MRKSKAMKTVLVLAPAWLTAHPPGNIARLASLIKKTGHEVKCFDLNIQMFQLVKNNDENNATHINARSWESTRTSEWDNEQNIAELIKYYSSNIDSWVDDILSEEPVIVGFTLYYISSQFSIEIAEQIRKKSPSTIIVFGGPLCFENEKGKELFNYTKALDYICYSEGEYALEELLKTLSNKQEKVPVSGFYVRTINGEIIRGDEINMLSDLNELPFADFSDFKLELYTSKMLPINSNRGCINRCAFCNESQHWGKFRNRTADNIFEEIKFQLNLYPSIEYLWFTDSLINGNIKIMQALCDRIIEEELNIKWDASAYIRKEMDEVFLQKLKAAGCRSLHYGLESGSNHVLKLMRKGYSAEVAANVLKNSVNSGIQSFVNIIVGFPGEKHKHYIETIKFIHFLNSIGITSTSINECYMMKGAALEKEKTTFGILGGYFNNWYSDGGFNNSLIRRKRYCFVKKVVKNKSPYITLLEYIQLYFVFPISIYIFWFWLWLKIKLNNFIHKRFSLNIGIKINYGFLFFYLKNINKKRFINIPKFKIFYLSKDNKINLIAERLVKHKLKNNILLKEQKHQAIATYKSIINTLLDSLDIEESNAFLQNLFYSYTSKDIIEKLDNESMEQLVSLAKGELNQLS